MRQARFVAAFIFLFWAAAAGAQQQFETLKKGFQADRLYHFADGFDSVSVYNGNLTIPMSIGPTYPLNGGLSYTISLVYNSNVWDQELGPNGTVHVYPSPRSNAGNGWLLGLGRFISPTDPRYKSLTNEAYEAPDGGDHVFDILHPDCTANSCPSYTTDGSNLRLVPLSPTAREVDSPDGVIRTFGQDASGQWQLTGISSTASNDTVSITYGVRPFPAGVPCVNSTSPGSDSYWKIHDSQNRDHYVCFNGAVNMVDRVVLSPIQGHVPVYAFTYHVTPVPKGDEDNDSSPDWAQQHDVALLDRLLLPDNSAYNFGYFDPVANREVAQVKTVTLPTGGKMAYSYSVISIPSRDMCASAYGELAIGTGFASKMTAIVSRSFTPVVPAGQSAIPQVWGYASRTFLPDGGYTAVRNCNAANPNVPPSDVQLYDEMVVSVSDPAGGQTRNHFSIFPGRDLGRTPDQDTSPANFKRLYFSFPYGTYDQAQDRYLSQEVFDCTTGTCTKQREIWVRHDIDPIVTNDIPPHRLSSQRTVFTDDCAAPVGCRWTSSDSTEWDGYGHYRTITNRSNFGGGGDFRSVTTSWNKAGGAQRNLGPSDKWVLNTYEDVTTTAEDATTNAVTVTPVNRTMVEQACFETTTGFLRGKRVLSGTSPSGTDLLTKIEKDATTGNVIAEGSYGGDLTPVTSNASPLCTALDALTDAPAYRTTHTWQNGQMQTSQADGVPFKSMDLAIDASGFISTSTDPTGRATGYSYDSSGRLTGVAPPEVAPTTYVYTNALVVGNQLNQPATVEESTSSTEGAGSIRRQYQFDSLGRLWREKHLMPDNSWSVRETTYDLKNRRRSVSGFERLPAGGSEFGFSPSHTTVFDYDAFDRQTQITAPDNALSFFTYGGTRFRTKTVGIAIDPTQPYVDTRETYDGEGRLVAVTEALGRPEEAATTYGYDVGGRLTTVRMPAPGGTQARNFTYDHRGFLLSEQHPELGPNGNGSASYTEYDARGHAHRKTVGAFDVRTAFDAAERATLVTDLATGNVLKQFRYDGTVPSEDPQCTGNRCMGRLAAAGRWNYDPDLGTVLITESYQYDGRGGRNSRRDRFASSTATFLGLSWHFGQLYNDLGLTSSVVYPCHPGGTPCTSDGPQVPFTYTNGLLTRVDPWASAITYQANGLTDTVTHGSGSGSTLETWIPDPSGMTRPQRIRATNSTGTELWSTGDYAYDGSGNIMQTGANSYAYDALGRLQSWSSSAGQRTSLTYDRFGNRLQLAFGFCGSNPDGSRRCGGSSTIPYQVAGRTNHYVGMAYDDAGNVTNDGNRAFTYDPLGVTTRTVVGGRDFRYLYTPDDERAAVVERRSGANKTTWSVRGFENQVLGVWTDDSTSGARSVSWKEDEIFRGALLLANSTPGQTHQYSLDHLGSPRLVTDSTGNHMQDFDPFGAGGLIGSGALQFTGHERDIANVGDGTADLPDYMHARYYNSGLGRFLSVDPALDLKKTITTPQAWNRYAYVRNNPLRYVDPDGRLDYDSELLGRRIHVHIDDHLSMQRQRQLQGQVNASITAINSGQNLTRREMTIIKNIRSIDVNNSAHRSFVQERTGALTLTPNYVRDSSAAWLGSAIAHDGKHVDLYNQGGTAMSRGLPAEVTAMRFQLEVGRKIGLSVDEQHYIEGLVAHPEQLRPYVESPP